MVAGSIPAPLTNNFKGLALSNEAAPLILALLWL